LGWKAGSYRSSNYFRIAGATRFISHASQNGDALLSIVYGLTSALAWGAADFTGGLATRRVGAYRAVLFGESVGLLFLLPVAFRVGETLPDVQSWILAALAGSLGTLGLLLLYHALATGTMSVAAPVSALMTAVLPVVVGSFTEGFPGPLTFLGFGLALMAIWLISQTGDGVKNILAHVSDLRLPLLAGIGFGSYFVLMHAAARHTTLWPMVASRAAGWLVIALFLLFRRDSWRVPSGAWPLITVNGILDVGGNAFFILAAQVGRLDIASVLSSLYPGATVVLAALVLKERLARNQWLGILSALIGIVLLASS
jgi:drug/metabolite transporter (DMT)-like permease